MEKTEESWYISKKKKEMNWNLSEKENIGKIDTEKVTFNKKMEDESYPIVRCKEETKSHDDIKDEQSLSKKFNQKVKEIPCTLR